MLFRLCIDRQKHKGDAGYNITHKDWGFWGLSWTFPPSAHGQPQNYWMKSTRNTHILYIYSAQCIPVVCITRLWPRRYWYFTDRSASQSIDELTPYFTEGRNLLSCICQASQWCSEKVCIFSNGCSENVHVIVCLHHDLCWFPAGCK